MAAMTRVDLSDADTRRVADIRKKVAELTDLTGLDDGGLCYRIGRIEALAQELLQILDEGQA